MADALRRAIGAIADAFPGLDTWSVADALWLGAASYALTAPQAPTITHEPKISPADQSPPTSGEPAQPAQPPPAGRSAARLFEPLPTSQTARPAHTVTIAAARPVANSLAVGRALHPFMRRWRRGTEHRLDIDATVDDYARSGVLMPITEPLPERWFEALIVADTASSMAVWQQEIAALASLLRGMGAFRNVHLWHLDASGVELTDDRGNSVADAPRRMRVPGARRLVLLVSDFASAAWRSAAPWRLVRDLGATTPIVLIDPLPTRLWRHSGLDHPIVRVRASNPGAYAARLRYRLPLTLRVLNQTAGYWLPVPITGLTVHGLSRWACATMRAQPDGCDAVLIPATGRDDETPEHDDTSTSIADLVDAFVHTASPPAVRLGILCSAFNRLSLPLLHLIRQTEVPEADLADIAEVLVSGLLSVERPGRKAPVLRFRAGAAEVLREHLTYYDAWHTFEAISRHIEHNPVSASRNSASGIPAAMASATGDTVVAIDSHPFAAAANSVLRVLGLDINLSESDVASDPPDAVMNSGAAVHDHRALTAGGHEIDALLDRFQEIAEEALKFLDPELPDPSLQDQIITKHELLTWLETNLDTLVDAAVVAERTGRYSTAQRLTRAIGLYCSCPPVILGGGMAPTLEFVRSFRSGASRMWRGKLLLVGEGGTGKTSLIRALTHEPHDPIEKSTHGLMIKDVVLASPDEPVNMWLSAWDFGAQQIYHATHQFFLTDHSLFLLLWSARAGWEHGKLRYWLDIITARAPGSPILLVATHMNDRPVDLPLYELRQEYPRIVDSIVVDNATREGLDTLRQRLTEEATRLPLMGSEWPTTWLAAAEAVRTARERYVTTSRLWTMMAATGVREQAVQHYIAVALHELGDILYYSDDPELSQTVILNPAWMNDYISMVLDSEQVAAAQGLLTRRHLNELWPDLDPGLRNHFLNMMDKYDLSYRIRDDQADNVSVIVECLPWNPPDFHAEWDEIGQRPSTREIRVLYRLNTMPPGIPTWFIARSHRFSTQKHWRTGALLGHGDRQHLALVRADTHRNIVELAVRGPMPAAFFSILDDGLNLTLERFPGLRITRQIPCRCSPDCPAVYDYDELCVRLARTPPKDIIECRNSGEDVSVPELLLGLAPLERDTARMSIEQMSTMLTQLTDKVEEQPAFTQRMFLRTQRQIQMKQEARCPSVFSIVPAKNRPAGSAYELHLYCEEPGAWHRLPEPSGCYPITQPTEWIRKLGPYVKHLLKTLNSTTPLGGPVLGVAPDKLDQQAKADAELMQELLNQAPDEADHTPAPTRLDNTKPAPATRTANDADYRALLAMLTTVDPDQTWGGLSQTTTPEGLTLYLCEDHLAGY